MRFLLTKTGFLVQVLQAEGLGVKILTRLPSPLPQGPTPARESG